jgi:hypothetical protein
MKAKIENYTKVDLKQDLGVWAGFIWHRTLSSGWLLSIQKYLSGSLLAG